MTRQELIERIDRHAKRAVCWGIVWLISVFAVLGLLVIIANWVSPAIETVMGAVFFAFMVGTVLALLLGLGRSQRRLGLVCPYCHVLLTRELGPVAVATGRCGKCGKPIVDATPGKD